MKNKRGISLIVLIITILVMIILAAAIILNIDDTKIINNAERATVENNMAVAKETRVAAKAEWRINQDKLREEGYTNYTSYLEDKIESAGLDSVIMVSGDETLNYKYEDSNGDIAIIPEGFSISKKESEKIVDDGLVIIDSNGNEFVWVPVDNYERFERTTKYKATETITDPGTNYTEPFSKTTDDGITLSLTNDLTGEWKEYAAMRASVEANKGFYIGRYEAGTPLERTNTANGTTEVVVQKNKPVYNYVGWGPSLTDAEGDVTYGSKNQGKGAVELSRQMYKGSKSVVSTLCYGVQWDAALQFIATKDATYPTDSTGKGYYVFDSSGNYIGGETANQPTGYYSVNNIYDMAGNVWEWTMEAYAEIVRISRGGAWGDAGSSLPASFRGDYNLPDYAEYGVGFRVTLYIK